MPSAPLADSMTQKLGSFRCRMIKPDPSRPKHQWLGRTAIGTTQIDICLAHGFVIVDDPFNHLPEGYGQESKQKEVSHEGSISGPLEVQEKRRPGRPRKEKRHG